MHPEMMDLDGFFLSTTNLVSVLKIYFFVMVCYFYSYRFLSGSFKSCETLCQDNLFFFFFSVSFKGHKLHLKKMVTLNSHFDAFVSCFCFGGYSIRSSYMLDSFKLYMSNMSFKSRKKLRTSICPFKFSSFVF